MKYEQLSIFNEAEAEADPDAEESEIPASESDETEKSKRYPGRQKSKLKESNVTKTEEIHDISDEVKNLYGDRLKFIGYNIKNELIHHPAWYEYKEHKQCIYKVEGELNENGGEVFIKGTMPLLPLGKSYASASLLSKVITDKFDKGIPFTRQERICREQGVPIIKQTMANWMIQLDCNYYNVLAEHIRKRIVSGSHSIGDETRVQVLKEEGKNPETESWMWAIMNGRSEKDKMIYFMYAPDRTHKNAQIILDGFKKGGILLADGWQAYDKIEGAVRANDWSHLRRKLVDVVNAAPQGTNKKATFAGQILSLISKLFRYDKRLDPKKMSYDEIRSKRQEKQLPIVDEIFKKIKSVNIPKSTLLYKACEYALNQEQGLRKYLDDGRIEITSNIIEREMKAFGISRKNFLFMNTPNGATASAHLFSVMRTAVMNGLDPERYLTFLNAKLPYLDLNDENEIEKVMPWSDSLPEDLKARKKRSK